MYEVRYRSSRLACELRRAALLASAVVFFGLCLAHAAHAATPVRPMRVAYIEGGFYTDYAALLVSLAQGLQELGVLKQANIPVTGKESSTKDIWDWLCANTSNNNIEFVADAYYSANWNNVQFEKQKNALLSRLAQRKDIDLVLAFGTKAGQAMAWEEQNVPIAVLSATDPITTGISTYVDDSGRNNIYAVVEENRHYRELRLFHNIFAFKKLGIVYEDSESGRGSVAYSQIVRAARDGGFDLMRCTDSFFSTTSDVAANKLIACHEKLISQGVDAVYLTINNGMDQDRMHDILAPLLQAGLPTFSQNGVNDVKKGALLSVWQENFKGQGMTAAKAIANILHGQLPQAQKQRHEESLSLAVNLHTAMLIGWRPSLDVLAALDKIFERSEP